MGTQKDSKRNIMTEVFVEMLFIQIMAVITATIGSVVDGIITGNFLGRGAMAAFSIATPFFVFLSCFSNMIGNGAQSLGGRMLGKGDKDGVNGIFSLTIVSISAIGLIILFLAFMFSNQIAILLGANSETVGDVAAYIRGLSIGVLPIMLNGPVMRFLQLDNAQGFSFLGVVIMTVFNICGDFMNVYVFKQGMFGMALATSMSYYAAVILLAMHFFSKKNGLKMDIHLVSLGQLKDVIVVGLPTAVGQICTVLRSLVLNRIFLFLAGTVFVAAYAGQNTIATLLCSVSLGFGMTTLLIGSVLVGEEDRTSIVRTMKDSLKISIIINTILAILVIVGANYLAAMFGKGDTETIKVSARILKIYAISLPINIINVNLENYFQSMKKTLLVNVLCIFNNLGFMVLFALVLPMLFGKDAVWYLFPLAELSTLVLIFSISVKYNHGIPRSFEQFLMLDDEFGVDEKDRLDISIIGMDEVIGVSESVHEFCKLHGVDGRRSYFSSLAIEEMAGNIVEHGFDDKKKHVIEIRVAYKDDRLRIRIRDDCKGFNPTDHITKLSSDNMLDGVGIRLVSQLSKSFKYQSTFNLNVLSIEM